jgi:hypothetical protein
MTIAITIATIGRLMKNWGMRDYLAGVAEAAGAGDSAVEGDGLALGVGEPSAVAVSFVCGVSAFTGGAM